MHYLMACVSECTPDNNPYTLTAAHVGARFDCSLLMEHSPRATDAMREADGGDPVDVAGLGLPVTAVVTPDGAWHGANEDLAALLRSYGRRGLFCHLFDNHI